MNAIDEKCAINAAIGVKNKSAQRNEKESLERIDRKSDVSSQHSTSCESEEHSENEYTEEENNGTLVGFGDAMNKVLQQHHSSNAIPILAKRTTARMREIQQDKLVRKQHKNVANAKREKNYRDMVLPSHKTIAKDRSLRMIATKGVVALFNAIEKHQHAKKASGDDEKVQKLSKESFLDMIKTKPTDGKPTRVDKIESSDTKGSQWLKDSYMIEGEKGDSNDTTQSKKRKGTDTKFESNFEEAEWDAFLDSDNENATLKTPKQSKRKNKARK
ncbi:unnamed protein product [Albugo candida]|uniref:RRP15-like protein n=1 Tax=Albugo candida TaxID=65357 RepID=A0A024GLX2_9STRA|nr:unnamed protein product [Albugo candida]|eukprot:CCI47736.1 unnamed protein product [Albugo candida]